MPIKGPIVIQISSHDNAHPQPHSTTNHQPHHQQAVQHYMIQQQYSHQNLQQQQHQLNSEQNVYHHQAPTVSNGGVYMEQNTRGLSYISLVQHNQMHQSSNIVQHHPISISPSPSNESINKSNNHRIRPKSQNRNYSQENISNTIEVSNEVIIPATVLPMVVKRDISELKNHNIGAVPEVKNYQQKITVGENYLPQQLSEVEVSLGPNSTRIPAAIYEALEWTSVTSATRKLLITIFDRETLATHTMTGKPSPAFKGRGLTLQSKHQLNPLMVSDIIFAVSRKCSVPEKEVRTAITTKCGDENKMLKQREKKGRSLQLSNKENVVKANK